MNNTGKGGIGGSIAIWFLSVHRCDKAHSNVMSLAVRLGLVEAW